MKKVDLEALRHTLKLTKYPVNLVLEMTTSCNLRCINCPYPNMKREKRKVMEDGLYRKIIDEIAEKSPNKTILWYAFMGEPFFLKEKLTERIKYAKSSGIKNIYLNTNGTMINPYIFNLIDSGVDKIFISMDAFFGKTYFNIKGSDITALERDINYFLSIKERPEIVLQFIVMDENRDEEKLFVDYWIKKGATVKVRRKLGWGNEVNAPDLIIPQEKRNIPCPWLMRQMVVLCDGRVAQCDADFEGCHSAGDINKQTIYNVWNGELLGRRQKHIVSDFDLELCRNCNDWQVGKSEIYKSLEAE